jgi:hypothetical protein
MEARRQRNGVAKVRQPEIWRLCLSTHRQLAQRALKMPGRIEPPRYPFEAAQVGVLQPVLVAHIGRSAPFTFFAVMTVVQFVVVLPVYPETKGQTLEALQRRLVRAK